jgi:hypothetical protein
MVRVALATSIVSMRRRWPPFFSRPSDQMDDLPLTQE